MTRLMLRRGVASVLVSLVVHDGPLLAADYPSAGGCAVPAAALQKLAGLRSFTDCPVGPTQDSGRELAFRGRPAVEIKGRVRGDDTAGTLRDLAVFDPAADRIVAYVCFANASTRKTGDPIVSLAEISSRGDKLARGILPGSNLELESIDRHRTGETESVYYAARYASASGEFPFFEPPVRLLLNATTGKLYRLDVDPDWLDPVEPPRVRMSRKAAERIATVVLRGHDLAPAFGSGAVFGAVATAELFTVHPNDWLGLFAHNAAARARVAWVVYFRAAGDNAAGLHGLFVDAATGLVLGGFSGQSAGHPR